jgi:hypothetical protein
VLTERERITDIQAAAATVRRTLLMIPGPTAITAEVLAAGARPVLSHSDPLIRSFVAASLARLRNLFDAPASQPIIAAGSGTLAMDIGLANLIEPGDKVLILESGVFGGRFRTIAERNGAEVRTASAPLGEAIDPDEVRRAIDSFRPKVVTITHVDTSTGVRLDIQPLSRLARERDARRRGIQRRRLGRRRGTDCLPEGHRRSARPGDRHGRPAGPRGAGKPPNALPRLFHRHQQLAAGHGEL